MPVVSLLSAISLRMSKAYARGELDFFQEICKSLCDSKEVGNFSDSFVDPTGVSFFLGVLTRAIAELAENYSKTYCDYLFTLLAAILRANQRNPEFLFSVLPGTLSCCCNFLLSKDPNKALESTIDSLLFSAFTLLFSIEEAHLKENAALQSRIENFLGAILMKLSNSFAAKERKNSLLAHQLTLFLQKYFFVASWECLLLSFIEKFWYRSDRATRILALGVLETIQFSEAVESNPKFESFLCVIYRRFDKIFNFLQAFTSDQRPKNLPAITFTEITLIGNSEWREFSVIPVELQYQLETIPADIFSQQLLDCVLETDTSPSNFSTACILFSCSLNFAPPQAASILDALLQKEFFNLHSECCRASLCLADSIIAQIDALALSSRVPKLLYPLIQIASDRGRPTGILSERVLYRIAITSRSSSVSELFAKFQNSLFSSLSIGCHFQENRIRSHCLVFCRLMQELKESSMPLVVDVLQKIIQQIRLTHCYKDSETDLMCFLAAIDQYFILHSISNSQKMELPEDQDEKLSLSQKVTIELLECSRYLMLKDAPIMQYACLKILRHALPAARCIKGEFLPLAHKCWSVLVPRLRLNSLSQLDGSSKSIANAAIQVIELFCEYCGDFISDRLSKTILPQLGTLQRVISEENMKSFLSSVICNVPALSAFSVRRIFYCALQTTAREAVLTLLARRYPAQAWYLVNCSKSTDTVYVPSSAQSTKFGFYSLHFISSPAGCSSTDSMAERILCFI